MTDATNEGAGGPAAQPATADDGTDDHRNERTRLADGEGLEVATPEDFEVERDGNGERLPVPQQVPGTDKRVDVIPPTPGEFAEYADVFDGRDESSERQAAILAKHVEQVPDDADADYVENELKGAWLSGLLRCVRNAGGYEVLVGNRQQVAEEEAALMRAIDDEDLAGLMRGMAAADSGNGAPESSE